MPVLTHLTAQDAISYLVSRNGNADLAALDASRAVGHAIEPAYLISLIASDPSSPALLAQQMRMLVLIQTFDAVRVTHSHFMQSIGELKPKDAAAAYAKLLAVIDGFTAAPLTAAPAAPALSSNLNGTSTLEAVRRALPPDVADAVDYFLRQSPMIEGAFTLVDSADATPTTDGATPATQPL